MAAKESEKCEAGATCCEGPDAEPAKPPACIIVIGMAGSGKTTFVQVCETAGLI